MLNNQDKAPDTGNLIPTMRGKSVYDAENARVGSVSAVDAQTGYFVTQKGLFAHDLYIPLSAIVRSNATAIALNLTKEMLKDPIYAVAPTANVAPATGTAAATGAAAATGDSLAGSPSVNTPVDTGVDTARPITQASAAPRNVMRTDIEDIAVPIREESLLANKVAEKIGDVRVHRYIVEEEQTLVAPISHEEISIEHVVVTNLPTGADAFTEKDINVQVMGERLILGKETHVVEEVHIHKRQVTEQQQASGTVRKEHVKVDGDVHLEDDARDTRPRGDPPQQDRNPSDRGRLS